MNCNDHPNSNNPIFTLGGFSWPVCDPGETGGASGCDFRKEKDRHSCNVGDPVDPKLGVLQEQVTDFELGSQTPLVLARTYSSDPYVRGMMDNNPMNSRLGRGWRTNFDAHAGFWPDGNEMPGGVVITYPSGQQMYFEVRSGRYVTAPYNRGADSYAWKWAAPETLVYANGVFTATDEDGTRYAFNRAGQLLTITFLGGYQQTLEWVGGLNTRVTDNLGRSISFTYDANGMMQAASVPDGIVTRYDYVAPATQSPALAGRVFTRLPTSAYVLSKVTTVGTAAEADRVLAYDYGDSRFPDALTGIVDERGTHISTWTYDSTRRIASNQVSAGAGTFTFAYDEPNGRTTVTNPLSKQTVYRYDTNVTGPSVLTGIDGIASAHCLADITALAYETDTDLNQTNLVQKVDGEGRVTRYTRDQRGFMTSTTLGFGTADAATTTYTWHPTLYLVTQKVEPGLTTDYAYDGAGGLLTKTQRDTTTGPTAGQVRVWTYTRNAGGLVTAIDGPLAGTGDTVRYTYTTSGFLRSVMSETGVMTTVTARDRFGHPTSITDQNGQVTRLNYNLRGRLTSVTRDASGSATTTRLAYDAVGNLVGMTDALGATTSLAYDDGNQLTSMTLPTGESATFKRNALGDASSITYADAGGAKTFAQARNFDELGRLIQTLGANDKVTRGVSYDRAGNSIQEIDDAGASLTTAYDALNRAIRQTDGFPATTSLTRDGQGEITAYKDPRNLTTTYQRNGFGEVISETSPDRGTISYQRDARGLVTQKTDANGQMTRFTYDASGRLLGKRAATTSVSDVMVNWGDVTSGLANGRLLRVANGASNLSRVYDIKGRITTEWQRVMPQGRSVPVIYGYDANDQVASMTYPSGRKVTIERDAAGRAKSVSVTNGPTATSTLPIVTSATWMPFGDAASLTFGNGLVQTLARDLDGRITGLKLTNATGAKLLDRSLVWQGDRLLALNDGVSPILSQAFTYSAVGRLASARADKEVTTWTYDGTGNRASESKGGALTTYDYPGTSNRLATLTQGKVARSFAYDKAGNLVSDKGAALAQSYAYDDEGRLTGAASGTTTTTYAYDAFSRLVSRTPVQSPANAVVYVYDTNDHIVAETDTLGITQREYVWLDDLPIAVIDNANLNDPVVSYVHTDHLGRPVRMSASNGGIVWSAEYKPFGEVASLTGSASLDMRFPGQMFQLETGLAWNWHRHYDASLGRYLQPDPLGLTALMSDGPSVYGYVGGNPLGYVDTRGLIFSSSLNLFSNSSFGITNEGDCNLDGAPNLELAAGKGRSATFFCQNVDCGAPNGGLTKPLCPSCAQKLLDGMPIKLENGKKLDPGTDLFPK